MVEGARSFPNLAPLQILAQRLGQPLVPLALPVSHRVLH
jgi:hypothetical protein